MERLLKWSDGWGKLVIAAFGALYGLGMTVVNIHFSQFGLSDFSGVRPRFVIVGLAFLIFVSVPPAICVLLLWLGDQLRSHVRRSWLRSLFVICVGMPSVMLLVGGVLYVYLPISLYTTTSPLLGRWLLFWVVYLTFPGLVIVLFGICVPVSILFSRRSRNSSPGIAASRFGRLAPDRVVAAWAVAGAAGLIHPYSVLVYQNVSRSVGGGQPATVFMTMDFDAAELLNYDDVSWIDFDGDTIHGPFLVWHEADARYFVTRLGNKVRWPPEVYSIPAGKVRGMVHLPGWTHIVQSDLRNLSHATLVGSYDTGVVGPLQPLWQAKPAAPTNTVP